MSELISKKTNASDTSKFSINDDIFETMFLEMYAGPVENFLSLNQEYVK